MTKKRRHDKLSPTPIYQVSISSARDNLDDFQPVAGADLPLGKFRGRDRLAVVFHHDAARRQILRDKKRL